MFKYHCLNPISQIGIEKFSTEYIQTDHIDEADGILVRSAAMHDMELPKGLLAVARAGAGVNNIPHFHSQMLCYIGNFYADSAQADNTEFLIID